MFFVEEHFERIQKMKNIIAAVLLAMLALSFTSNAQTQINPVTSVRISGVGRSAPLWGSNKVPTRTTLVEGLSSSLVTWSLEDAPAGATAKVQLCAYETSARVRTAESLFKTTWTNTWCQDIVIGDSLANGSFRWIPEIPAGLSGDYYQIRVVFDLKNGTTVTNRSLPFRIQRSFEKITITSPGTATRLSPGGTLELKWSSKGIPPNAVLEVELTNPGYPGEKLTLATCSNVGGQLIVLPANLPTSSEYEIRIRYESYLGIQQVVSEPISIAVVTVPLQ
jgi:hypothetical protein